MIFASTSKLAAAVAGVMIALPAVVMGASVTYNAGTSPAVVNVLEYTIDSATVNSAASPYTYSGSLSLAQKVVVPTFDDNLGYLTKVTLTLTGAGSSTIRITNVGGTITVAAGDLSVATDMSLQDSGNHLTVAGVQASASNPQFHVDGANTQSFTLSNLASSRQQVGVFSGLVDVSEYTSWSDRNAFTTVGAGTRDLDITAFFDYAAKWSGNSIAKIDRTTSFGVSAQVTYDYYAVPEAGTMLLGGCAVMPLLAHRRRSKKA